MGTDNSVIIAAIPAEDDYVWKLSSETIPHMTLCYLGDQKNNPKLSSMIEYVEHVAQTSLTRFGMDVDHRGTLGDKDADVLFFGEHNKEKLEQIRSYFLTNDDIAKAYYSTEQYPEWTPHLTLGYPEAPAKPDDREYPGTRWVNFDRIAVWYGDSEGPEFLLKPEEGLSMSDRVGGFLSHFGVKGMHWGIRKTRDTLKIGGEDSSDASDVRKLRKKARGGGPRRLSDKELQRLTKRLELEEKYNKIVNKERDEAVDFVKGVLGDAGRQAVSTLVTEGIKYAFVKRRGKIPKTAYTTVLNKKTLEGAARMISRYPNR
jgi:2'-5' RNA ligase